MASAASFIADLLECESNALELLNNILEAQRPEGQVKPNCGVELLVWMPQQGRKRIPWFFSSKKESCETLSRSFKHWAVLCSLDDGQSFLLDAVDKAGMLRGRMQVYEKSEDRNKRLEKLSLGVHRLDFNDLTQAFKAIGTSEKYNKIENNCQVWVVDLLRLLNIPVPPQVKTIDELIPKVRLLPERKLNTNRRTGTEQPKNRTRTPNGV